MIAGHVRLHCIGFCLVDIVSCYLSNSPPVDPILGNLVRYHWRDRVSVEERDSALANKLERCLISLSDQQLVVAVGMLAVAISRIPEANGHLSQNHFILQQFVRFYRGSAP